MSIGTWDPKAGTNTKDTSISIDLLQSFVAISQRGQLDQLNQVIDSETQAQQAALMTLEAKAWIDAAETLSTDDITHLIRFFTVAEMDIAGWQAESKSPVIGLVKALKQRGTPPDKDLILWIKSHTTNRFLPNGPL